MAPGPVGIVLSIAFVIVVGIIDHLTGAGRVARALLSDAGGARHVDRAGAPGASGSRAWPRWRRASRIRSTGPSVLVHSWNALVWFVVFGCVVWLVDALEATSCEASAGASSGRPSVVR